MSKLIPDFKIFLVAFFISLSLSFLDFIHFLAIPKGFVFYITNPISFSLLQMDKNIRKQFYFIFEARFASQENKALKEQISKLFAENAKIKRDLAEKESMLSQEKHLDPKNYNLIPARPIGISRYLKIDQGSSAGVKVGQAVVFNENLVGKVVAVSEKASNVALLTDPISKIAAFSQGLGGRAKGILLGQFGTDIIVDKILHEEKINVGDLVYSEGTEENLPRGLILGRVSEVMEGENEVFKKAKIQPVFDIRDLELIFVIGE